MKPPFGCASPHRGTLMLRLADTLRLWHFVHNSTFSGQPWCCVGFCGYEGPTCGQWNFCQVIFFYLPHYIMQVAAVELPGSKKVWVEHVQPSKWTVLVLPIWSVHLSVVPALNNLAVSVPLGCFCVVSVLSTGVLDTGWVINFRDGQTVSAPCISRPWLCCTQYFCHSVKPLLRNEPVSTAQL